MGCATSKLDDLPAVSLCRERCAFLNEAIQFRQAFAQAHTTYILSLQGVGKSLHNFIEPGYDYSDPSSSSKLKLPPQRKGDPDLEPSNSPLHRLSHSNSGSHLQLHSDSDDDSSSFHHSDHSSSLHQTHDDFFDYPDGNRGGGYVQINYMKNKAMPSVVHQQVPVSSERVYHMGESSSSSANYLHPYSNNGYPNYGGGYGGVYGGGYGGVYYGSSPPPAYGGMSNMLPPASSSKPPPPPPSPPRVSTWDLFNFFETPAMTNYYGGYTPGRDPREVREEEGIPELEDVRYHQPEVVKKVYGEQKFAEDGGEKHSKAMADDQLKIMNKKNVAEGFAVDDAVQYELGVVDKKVVEKDKKLEDHGKGAPAIAATLKGAGVGSRDIYEVVREIEVLFKKASEFGDEIAKMLEMGQLPHQRKHAFLARPPATRRRAKSSARAGVAEVVFVEDMGMRSGNLSSTLKKLYMWEKKLYNEVKGEEKMRMTHDKKRRQLKRLHERGAEAQKVEATQTSINTLATNLKIAIQVVDKISETINKIRDEELWPQVNELIQGLTRMWKGMLECHHAQFQAIKESRGLGHIRSGGKPSDVDLRVTLQLDHELISWTTSFSSWISAQKNFVRSLNNWLLKCLLYEPEESADGIVPFSPSRIGAPPIFVICNQWSQGLDRFSEKKVIDSMHVFAKSVLQIWEHDKQEVRQTMITNKDLERKVKKIDRDDQKLQKKIQALDKKLILVTEHVHGAGSSNSRSLQADLQFIFEALESFASDSMKAYEDLLQRSAEEIAKTRA
ncbi:protein ALTERED PHOSPHATE STARVATION RESPONSE 1-like [Benincasa hispida]|uniref:protein ALTERED PHOSPHATE STARVATION RESPONSE 1-like n=1 Tax=Benincasa hispida TaxID=102211 RepID=UPI0019000451|nr:protein ALTERED PHOSPHATE STARVATION RESPONSE 1-like [Benincasa hispida]